MRQLLTAVCFVAMVTGAVVAQSPPPIGDPSITLLTPNPTLGTTVYFAVTAPKKLIHYQMLIELICVKTEDPPQDPPYVGWIIYQAVQPWNSGFVLGGTDSIWLTLLPQNSVNCTATEFYTVKQAGQQQIKQLAFTRFDATGQQP